MDGIMIAAAAALMGTAFAVNKMQHLQLATVGDDSDVKVVPDTISGYFHKEKDLGEQEAERFLHHKKNGNIALATGLGEKLGNLVFDYTLPPEWSSADPRVMAQTKVLFVFAAETALAKEQVDSILAETAESALYEALQARSERIYDLAISPSITTQYRLCDRGNAQEIGKVFAKLCGDKDKETLAAHGEKLYDYLYYLCKEICLTVDYR